MTRKIPSLPELSLEEERFLKDIIEHHKMALVMAKDVLRTTNDYDVMSLSYSIMQTQTNEIALMQEMLRQRK